MSGDTVESILESIESSLTDISASPDDRMVKAYKFLETVFNFASKCLHDNVSVASVLRNRDLLPNINRITTEFVVKSETVLAISRMSERLASHPEYYDLKEACVARSGFEFLRLDLADSMKVYLGDLSVPDDRKDWSNSVNFREYADKLFRPKTVETFDKTIEFFILCRHEDGEKLPGSVIYQHLPESHWWWRAAAAA